MFTGWRAVLSVIPGERTGSEVSIAQVMADRRADYDAFLAGCPSRQLLARISDKWVALVLAALGSGGPYPGDDGAGEPQAMRYSELARRLAGVSQKMLTQTLRSLERDGLLTRTVTPTVPVTVTYELTALTSEGDAELATWTEAWYADYLAGWQRQIEEHLGTARSR